MCEFLVDPVGLRHKLRQHGVGLCIQGGGAGVVGHQPGVDGDIEPGGLQGGLAEQCSAPGIRYGHHTALFGVFRRQRDALTAGGHDLQRHSTGPFQRGLQHSGFVGLLLRGLFGQLVGCGQRCKGVGVGLYQPFQPLAEGGGTAVQDKDVRLHGGIFFLANGQAADHIAKGGTGGTHQSCGPAAARCRGAAGKVF